MGIKTAVMLGQIYSVQACLEYIALPAKLSCRRTLLSQHVMKQSTSPFSMPSMKGYHLMFSTYCFDRNAPKQSHIAESVRMSCIVSSMSFSLLTSTLRRAVLCRCDAAICDSCAVCTVTCTLTCMVTCTVT